MKGGCEAGDFVVCFVGPILEVMQYEADPWTGLSKLTAPVL